VTIYRQQKAQSGKAEKREEKKRKEGKDNNKRIFDMLWGIIYNVCRQRDEKFYCTPKTKNPGAATPGFLFGLVVVASI